MFNQEKSQMIIVNRSPVNDHIQIVVPPFRPISLYEIDDSFEDICLEINDQILDKELADKIVEFMEVFKSSIDERDALPIVEYFLMNQSSDLDPMEIKEIYDSIDEFIEEMDDSQRLMN